MASKNITALTNLTAPLPTMLMYAALSPFGLTDDRKITANALFATITANISDVSLQFDDGLAASTVAAVGKGKIRYNNTTKTFQASVDGGAYANLGGGGMSIGGAVAGGTTGSVLFVAAGPVLAQDNANFFWDGTNHRLGIGTTAPTVPLEFSGSLQNKINLLLGSTIGFGVQGGRFEMFTTGGAPIFLGQGPGGAMTDWLQVGAAIVRTNLPLGNNCNPQTSFVPLVTFGVIGLGTNNVTQFLQSAAGATVDQVNWLNISNLTNTVANQATFFTRSSGAVATGFGSSFTWDLTSTTTNDRNAARLQVLWANATDASRSAAWAIQIVDNANALAEMWRIAGNGAGSGTFETTTGVNGSQQIIGVISESLTLNVGGTTTDTTMQLPANSLIMAVTTRVTTTITTAVSFSVGDPTQAARFSASAGGLTVGSTRVGIDQWNPTVATANLGPQQATAASVRITTNANPGAGVIRITIHYLQFIAPTS